MSDDALNEYIDETQEILTRVNQEFALFVKDAANFTLIDSIYRDIHTIKGTAQLYGFNNIGFIAHALETLMDAVKTKDIIVDAPTADTVLTSLSSIEDLVQQIKTHKNDASDQVKTIVGQIIELGCSKISPQITMHRQRIPDLRHTDNNSLPKHTASEPIIKKQEPHHQTPSPQNETKEMTMTQEAQMIDSTTGTSPIESPSNKHSTSDGTVRVSVRTLDRLMNLVGEIVLVRNQVLQYSSNRDDAQLNAVGQSLKVVTTDLQDEVMKTRMQPIGNVLNKFQRVVRDIGRDLGKDIELDLIGSETELDRTLLEAINDPLTHIIRNACDHGIETPTERAKVGKKARGRITVRAFHEGGHIVIQIADDGRGINRDRVLKKAIERGLCTEVSAALMADKDIFNFIFAPGFSTAEKVSAVSGRGVGMDVVKTNIERIGGSVELNSQAGHSSQIKLKIPLTLAIVPALLISSSKQTFAIPQVKLEELVRVDRSATNSPQIEFLHGRPVYRLRGSLLTLLDLNHMISGTPYNQESVDAKEETNIVVVKGDGFTFGIVVDQIMDSADIVVKPMINFLKAIPLYSGATILGDGSVALILDASGITKFANISAHNEIQKSKQDSTKSANERTEFVIARLRDEQRIAIPLCLVSRLEDFPAQKLERSGKNEMIQYRDTILPLTRIDKYFAVKEEDSTSESVSVVVTLYKGNNYGIIVDRVLDVIETTEEIKLSSRPTKGLLGNVIHENEILSVADAHGILEEEFQVGVSSKDKTVGTPIFTINERTSNERKLILLVEDTSFFRKTIRKFLEEAGYDVIEANDGEQGFEVFNREKSSISLVLSDIEMPKLTGLELAKKIRDTGERKMPLVAITTKYSKRDVDIGKKAGFDQYLGKLNKEELLGTLETYLGAG